MSVRTALFVLLAALMLALIGAQWWLSQRQSSLLADALAKTAFSVSSDTVSMLLFGNDGEGGPLASAHVFDMSLEQQGRDGAILLSGDDWEQRVGIPREGLDAAIKAWHQRQYVFNAIIAGLALVAAAALAYGFARPLQRLQRAAEQVATGKLGVQVEAGASAPEELRATVDAFNQMSRELAKLEADNQALRAHEAANELTDLARGLAHTLRNPLNTLGLTLDEMSRTDLVETRREQLALMARRQIQQIDRWLRALLDVTQHDDQPLLQLDCHLLAQDVVQEFADRHPAIALNSATPAPQLRGHAREIASLLHTLISNAVEASSAGQPITVSLQSDGDGVVFTVSDCGNGLSAEVRERLFQPHVTTKSHGSGMGLFLARRIARGRYRGELTLCDNTDSPQGGTVARLQLHSRSTT